MKQRNKSEGTTEAERVRFGEPRRYLVDVDSISTNQLFTDCVIVGAGLAGLRAAIEAADHRNVVVVCKGTMEDSNTWKAQGGVASVLGKDDTFESHIADTFKTGGGICDEQIVKLVVRQGPELIHQLQEWGTAFDLVDGQVDITLEGGHSRARIVHAHGDETGRAIAETLIERVRSTPNIKVIENFYTVDVLTDEKQRCVGIIGYDRQHGLQILWAANTILASGGGGQLYRETTNPSGATADGIAMAYRAGAVLRDMEFVQFHPTTLYIAGASRALITETLRGEGAILLDVNGHRFMTEYDEAGELAPRDVVSRAILDQMRKTESTHVFLDVRHLNKEYFARRFPMISDLCESFDIDVSHDLIPVRPSAHYMIGGVLTDALGRTSIENLYACGEVASTGLHGANRLGSNSLLEGLVFGTIAGREVVQKARADVTTSLKHPLIKYQIPHSNRSQLDVPDVRNSLRALMWRNVGITRTAQPLTEAEEIIRFWHRYVMDKVFDSPEGWECQNMLTASLLVTCAAQLRKESRGVHYRVDHPETDDAHFRKHIEIVKAN
ncbi:L-aspartate oxidase [Anaerobaca lacustris]|uniref:L-aspartate oxidase n=1 Tax=Anaerobaca lacustris TaxID=3044600 RepID=A0AAW6TRM1_9BACT|nr:L-aspartate oxidase [Sedimentisphaerales bacterium M17dextr]